MKKYLLSVALLSATFLSAQTVNSKMGKPTDEEMNMTTYAPDPEADAVVLYSDTQVKYDFNPTTGDFRLIYNYQRRIKVLTQQGTDAGNITLSYYDPEETSLREEIIDRLKVNTYNLENGKVVRSKMNSDLENKERIDNYNCQIKCAAPNVKIGSVIEYEYTLSSDYYFSPNTWFAQCEYPTLYTHYSISVPDWFSFNCYPSGRWSVTYTRKPDNASILVGASLLSTAALTHDFVGQNMPALEGDDYVYSLKDFSAHVEHELKSIQIPGSVYKQFNSSWGDLCGSLVKSKDFGSRFNMENPLAEQQKELDLSGLPWKERVARLQDLLDSQYKWNGSYSLWGASARKVRNDKDRELNLGTYDFVFMSMLRQAGITAHPVVFSRRSKGRLPYYPSSRYFSGMVLYIETADSTGIYLDPTSKDYPIGTLPPDMMASQAFILKPDRYHIADLSRIAEGRTVSMTEMKVTADGVLEGKAQFSYRDETAGSLRHSFHNAKDSTEFVQKRTTHDNIEVSNYQLLDINSRENTVKELFNFSQTLEAADGRIYLNPFILLQSENPFSDENRILPIEFPFTTTVRHTISLSLPEGYVVEEMPKNRLFSFSEKSSLRLNIRQQEDRISIAITLIRNELLVETEMYADLRDYESHIQELFEEMIVLKKAE